MIFLSPVCVCGGVSMVSTKGTGERRVKVMTKGELKEFLFRKQDEWGYNRQAEPAVVWWAVKEHPEGCVYPVSVLMLHEHRAGVAVDPHYRCWLTFGSEDSNVWTTTTS